MELSTILNKIQIPPGFDPIPTVIYYQLTQTPLKRTRNLVNAVSSNTKMSAQVRTIGTMAAETRCAKVFFFSLVKR